MTGANFDNSAVGQNDFGRKNVIRSGAVNWNVRAGRIVRDHAANRGARTGRDVRSETKSVRFEKRVQLIEHDTSADADGAIVDVEIVDLAIVAREIDDQSFTNRISDETCSGAARSDGNIFIGSGFDDCAGFLGADWKGDAERLDLINGSVGGVKLAGQVVETHIAV